MNNTMTGGVPMPMSMLPPVPTHVNVIDTDTFLTDQKFTSYSHRAATPSSVCATTATAAIKANGHANANGPANGRARYQ